MKRHLPGRHRAPLTLPIPSTTTATASGLLLAAFGVSTFVAPAVPPSTFGVVASEPALDSAAAEGLGGAGSSESRALKDDLRIGETAVERPARAVAAPSLDAVEHRHFGELGFTGVTPQPEPQPALEPEPQPVEEATDAAAPDLSDAGEASVSAAQNREDASAGSRSQSRPAAPEPAAAPAAAPAASPASSQGAEGAIAWAQSNLGLPYSWGSNSGGAYDCSGFTNAAFRAAGVSIPHGSEAQYHATSRVSLSEIRRGDLLFYSTNGSASGIFHVAIYLGDGQVVHSLRDWSAWDGSKISGLHYASGLMGAGRP